MDTHTAARKIRENFPGLDDTDLARALDWETDNARSETKPARRYGAAVETACERILEWLRTAGEYNVNPCEYASLARFVASHRPACVWAVFAARATKGK